MRGPQDVPFQVQDAGRQLSVPEPVDAHVCETVSATGAAPWLADDEGPRPHASAVAALIRCFSTLYAQCSSPAVPAWVRACAVPEPGPGSFGHVAPRTHGIPWLFGVFGS